MVYRNIICLLTHRSGSLGVGGWDPRSDFDLGVNPEGEVGARTRLDPNLTGVLV